METRLEQFNLYRPLLFGIAYRMLGSAMDAEDMVQETFLRWQQATEEIQSPKSYLATIVTRLCIDHLRSARSQREQYIGPWLPEPLLTTENTPLTETLELAESLSMAFLVLLESLAPIERAVFLLREVFGYEYPEIARIVGKSETNCRQIARRAKEHIAAKRPRFDATREQQEEVTQRFIVACVSGDMQALLSVLAPDVVLEADSGGKVSAARKPIYGAEQVARALFGILKLLPSDANAELARVNAQPAIIGYTEGRPFYVTVLDIVEGRIQGIYNVLNPDKLVKLPPMSPSQSK
jgi:RNA polymerase sigma-70 factor (ECF subfamily)